MAYPWIFEEDFELGTKGDFDTETDTDGALDFPSYRTLAGYGMEPYSGAYCLRLISGIGTNAATLTEADINIADTVTRWFRFNLMFSKDFACTATDVVHLLELTGAASAVTVAFGFRITITTNVINLAIGGANTGAVPDNFSSIPIERGLWYSVEIKANIQTGGTGTLDVIVTKDGKSQTTTSEVAVTTLTNIAVTDGLLGLQNHLTTTTGTILIDNFVMDDAQIFRNRRYPETRLLTKTGHAFVGPGKIDSLTLLSGAAADNTCKVYDSDEASSVDLVAEMSNSIAAETVGPHESVSVQNGAYVVLSGTQPRALVKIGYAPYSAGSVRDIGRAR